MSELHGLLSGVVAVLLAALAAAALLIAVLRRAPRWLGAMRLAVLAVLVVEASIGLVLFAAGRRPAELLHWLYAAAALGALPLAASLGADAPPRPRAGLLTAGAAIGLVMVWRLSATG